MAMADVRVLEELIGREALLVLIRAAGGLSIFIPKRFPPMSGPLLELDPAAQEALVRYAGGTELYIPRCAGSRREQLYQQIRAEYDAGARVQDLARKYQFTERWIYEVLGRPGRETAQGDLF